MLREPGQRSDCTFLCPSPSSEEASSRFRRQGRQRRFQLAGPQIARALESLAELVTTLSREGLPILLTQMAMRKRVLTCRVIPRVAA